MSPLQISADRNLGGSAGFTLLETLVALSILAIAFSSLFGAFSGGLRAVKTSDDYIAALNLAETLLADNAGNRDFKLGTERGVARQFSWTIDITPAASSDGSSTNNPEDWSLFNISVRVAWARKRELRLATVRLGKRRGRDSGRL